MLGAASQVPFTGDPAQTAATAAAFGAAGAGLAIIYLPRPRTPGRARAAGQRTF